MKRVLVVVAHSDDETIGAGGTIAKHVSLGDEVFAVSLTNGVSSRSNSDLNSIENRKNSANLAAEILGFRWLETVSFPDNELDTISILELAKTIEALKEITRPDVVYTHSQADLNVDHRRVHEAVLVAFRPEPSQVLEEIRLFEVPSSTDFSHRGLTQRFHPQIFEEVSGFWELKKKALLAYGDEIRPFPHARSLEALEAVSVVRGTQVGLAKAEAFELVRRVSR